MATNREAIERVKQIVLSQDYQPADRDKHIASLSAELGTDQKQVAQYFKISEGLRKSQEKGSSRSSKEVEEKFAEMDYDDSMPQKETLMKCAKGAQLWRDADDATFATVHTERGIENFDVHSKKFKGWLRNEFYRLKSSAPSNAMLEDVINCLGAKATFEGKVMPTAIRLAAHDNAVYLDLCDEHHRIVKIDALGWEIVADAPVKFLRKQGMAALPNPTTNGSITDLRAILNVATEQDWQLIVSWLLAALRPSGPYPILVMSGEQGCGKSFMSRLLRNLIDPSKAPLRSQPSNEEDLCIAANNGWVIALDNMSSVQNWLSDALCRVATGGGFSKRKLYSDDEENILAFCRPCILNGISDLASRSDLLDRSIVINLELIPDELRLTEQEILERFDEMKGRLLGALCDVISEALRQLPNTRLETKPRMADFAQWVTAAEKALGWAAGSFMEAYTANRLDSNEISLDRSIVAKLILVMLGQQSEWEGTATELLTAIRQQMSEHDRYSGYFPKTPSALSGELRRIAPNLRSAGIDVAWTRDSNKKTIKLSATASLPSAVTVREDHITPINELDV